MNNDHNTPYQKKHTHTHVYNENLPIRTKKQNTFIEMQNRNEVQEKVQK